jgi:hypothetical protein
MISREAEQQEIMKRLAAAGCKLLTRMPVQGASTDRNPVALLSTGNSARTRRDNVRTPSLWTRRYTVQLFMVGDASQPERLVTDMNNLVDAVQGSIEGPGRCLGIGDEECRVTADREYQVGETLNDIKAELDIEILIFG